MKFFGIALVGMLAVISQSVVAKDLSKPQQEKLKEAVREKLSDPDSAKFTLPVYKGGEVYCGLVNSKNRMGGYAGNAVFQAFVLKDTPAGVYILGVGTADSRSSESSALLESCSEHGYLFR